MVLILKSRRALIRHSNAATCARQRRYHLHHNQATKSSRPSSIYQCGCGSLLIAHIAHRVAFAAVVFSALPPSSLAVDMPDLLALFDSQILRAIHLAFDL